MSGLRLQVQQVVGVEILGEAFAVNLRRIRGHPPTFRCGLNIRGIFRWERDTHLLNTQSETSCPSLLPAGNLVKAS